jgi:GTP-binding protein
MKTSSASFVASAVRASQYPPDMLFEIAFAGRSNVGKSSLINRLLNRKKLVKTSSTPGRTQCINFFLVNDSFHFVDLPGYGYAKVPANVQKKWGPMVEQYLKGRRLLKSVIVIIDIRRTPSKASSINRQTKSPVSLPCRRISLQSFLPGPDREKNDCGKESSHSSIRF